jgi:hypothetical protein
LSTRKGDAQCKDCKAEREAYEEWTNRFLADGDRDQPPKPPATSRPAPHPGPRCASHHRAESKRVREANRNRRVQNVYGLGTTDYAELKEFQGGVCAICRRANGRTRALSVDHDHQCCNGPRSCGTCVRGLLCRPCNDILGHLRDDVAAFERAIEYLNYPPMKRFRIVREGSSANESPMPDL